jgi:hypothetical protein
LRIAYELKEELREIYLAQYNGENGIEKVKKWLSSAQIILGKVARRLNVILTELLITEPQLFNGLC